MLNAFLTGFFTKLITGIDDSFVHIPIIAHITKTRKGKIAFALGILLAITFALILGALFASLLRGFQYYNCVSGGLIIVLAFLIYFNLFGRLFSKKEKSLKKTVFSTRRFFNLLGTGFLIALITIIDDTIAYSAILLAKFNVLIYVVLGIYFATFCQLFLIIYFSSQVQKIPYKREISFIGLLVLGILILFEII